MQSSADYGTISRFKLQADEAEEYPYTSDGSYECGDREVPWGIAASPDGNALFVACNRAYSVSGTRSIVLHWLHCLLSLYQQKIMGLL